MDKDLVEKYRTLSVIAVVVILALLLISSFVSLKEKKDFGFKFKVFYSDFSQSIQHSVNNNGEPSQWGWISDSDNAEVIENYLASGLRISKSCLRLSRNCFSNHNYKNLKNQHTILNLSKKPSFVMQNGVSVAFDYTGECKNPADTCVLVYVDINGDSYPNVIGKDLLVFELLNNSNSILKPYAFSKGMEFIEKNTEYGCNKAAKLPYACSSLLYFGNWRHSKSYPW